MCRNISQLVNDDKNLTNQIQTWLSCFFTVILDAPKSIFLFRIFWEKVFCSTFSNIGTEYRYLHDNIWDKIFKNGPSKICRRQRFIFHKFYMAFFLNFLSHSCIASGLYIFAFFPNIGKHERKNFAFRPVLETRNNTTIFFKFTQTRICCKVWFNPFQPSASFHIETSYLVCSANQMTGFYMKRNTRLKWVKVPNSNLLN